MAAVSCNQFEAMLSDYLGQALEPRDSRRFAEHALLCRNCRALLDDVKARLKDSHQVGQAYASRELEDLLVKIPSQYNSLTCSGFEELITDFLDGFLPAPAYHRFAAHSANCNVCSSLLTDVVLAIAAAHSVHIYEEVEVPEALASRLQNIAIGDQKRRKLARFKSLLRYAFPRAWPRVAAAAAIGFATLLSGRFGFGEVLRTAGLKAVSLYSNTLEFGANRMETAAASFNSVWQSIGGTDNKKQPKRAADGDASEHKTKN
jgi:predicted anti-sigma-YlaC factor YlaD